MPIRIEDERAVVDGILGAEDAEALLEALRPLPRRSVDLSACEHLHAAALQVLLALRPRVQAWPADEWLCAALRSLEAA